MAKNIRNRPFWHIVCNKKSITKFKHTPTKIAPNGANKSSFLWFEGKIFKKIDEIPHIDIFRPKRGRKFGPRGSFFTHIWKYPQYACKPSLKVWHKKLYEKMAKNLQNSQFWPIFVIKNPLKIKSNKSKFCGQYCCGHSSQISERSDENWRSLFDLKKVDDGRLVIG